MQFKFLLVYLLIGTIFLIYRILGIYIFIYLFFFNTCFIIEWDFFFSSSITREIFIYLDIFFFLMSSIVRLIRGNVIFYSVYYMGKGKYNYRFLFLLVSFILRIFFFICTPNIVRIFLGWDGLGLTSYLLVNFYGNRRRTNSAILTVLTNRLGDVFLLVGVFFSLSIGGWKFIFWEELTAPFIFVLARFTKRAQLPFSRWLPFAIAAPTPVSSLVHSSTLVTAGVFFIFRLFDLIKDNSLYLIFTTGILTMLISSVCAIFESDLKKVIALSTLRQLGMIIILLGLGFKNFCFFHLIAHALFKSALFMSMGCKIHEFGNSQDSRSLGMLWKNNITDFFFGVTNLALIGFPFMSGFFSKDLGLEFMLSRNLNFLLRIFFLLRITLTVSYRLKFVMLRRINFSNFWPLTSYNLNDKFRIASLLILLKLRTIFGYIYFKVFLDNSVIIDLLIIIKFSILFFIFNIFLFINNYLSIKIIFKNKFSSFYRFLFFLRELTRSVKANLLEFMWSFKSLDRGYLDLVKSTTLVSRLRSASIYLESIIIFSSFIFLNLLLYNSTLI